MEKGKFSLIEVIDLGIEISTKKRRKNLATGTGVRKKKKEGICKVGNPVESTLNNIRKEKSYDVSDDKKMLDLTLYLNL